MRIGTGHADASTDSSSALPVHFPIGAPEECCSWVPSGVEKPDNSGEHFDNWDGSFQPNHHVKTYWACLQLLDDVSTAYLD